jgi:hypothetical protein
MPRRGPSVAQVIWASALAGVFAGSASDTASAASDCRLRPGGPGTHWFYRIEQRKCWYAKQVGPAPTESHTGPPEQAESANADSQSTFMSWLSSKVSGVTSATEAEQSLPTRSASTPRATPPEAPPRRRTQVASRSERAKAPPARSAQQSSPPTARAQAPAPTIDDATSEALFREFLQWRVKQLFAPE